MLVGCIATRQFSRKLATSLAVGWLFAPWVLNFAGCAGAGPPIEGKIAVMDPARALNDTNTGKKAKEALAAFSKNRQALIELEEKELRRMEEDFIKQASVLNGKTNFAAAWPSISRR